MNAKRIMAIGVMGFSLGTGSGCVALAIGAAAGVGTYAYVEGKLTDTEEAPLDKAYAATLAAMKELEYPIKEQSKDALEAHVLASQSDKTEVSVGLESKGEHLTKFTIRVGVFGDDTQSRFIMDKIRKHL